MTRSFIVVCGLCRRKAGITMAKAPTAPGGVVGKVVTLVQPIIGETDLILWDVRFLKEGASWILRIVIDREDAPVSINDCVAVSRRLSPLLDEADPIPQSYCLEVTSPGADRELTRPEHFTYYEGLPVCVKLYRPDETGQREIAGILDSHADKTLSLVTEEGETRTFDRKDIAAVHAIDDFDDEDDESAQSDT